MLEENDFVEVEIDDKYDTRKEKLKNEWELEMKCFEDRYIHIKEAMDQSQITIDAAAAETYLKELKKRVLSKVVKENKTQVKKYFKKSHKVIENIEKGNSIILFLKVIIESIRYSLLLRGNYDIF